MFKPSFLLILIILIFSICCSGGSNQELANTDNENNSIKFELINYTLNKTAVISANTLFIISSDQKDRTDPTEATHIRTQLIKDGRVFSEQLTPISREVTPPYSVIQSDRFVTLTGIPNGTYSCIFDLGQDFGRNSNTRKETIYYKGTLDNFSVKSNSIYIDNKVQEKVLVPLRLFRDENSGEYSIQGYIDFSSIPKFDLIGDAIEVAPSLAFAPIESDFAEAYPANIVVNGNIFTFQSHFFEVRNIPLAFSRFNMNSNAGPPENYSLSGFITREDSLSGALLLFDWETTYNYIFNAWFNFFYSQENNITLYEANYKKMPALFAKYNELITYTAEESVKKLNFEELNLVTLSYMTLWELNRAKSRPSLYTEAPSNFDRFLASEIHKSSYLSDAINHYYFSDNVSSSKLEITTRDSVYTFTEAITNTSTYDPNINGIPTSGNTNFLNNSELVKNEIQPYLNKSIIIDYITKITSASNIQ